MRILSDADVTFVSEVSHRMNSFVTYVETEEEDKKLNDRVERHHHYFYWKNGRESLVNNTLEFVETKFEDQMVRMGNWNFVMTFAAARW